MYLTKKIKHEFKKDTCSPIFTVVLFIAAKVWKQRVSIS